jgi:hypothetical protein
MSYLGIKTVGSAMAGFLALFPAGSVVASDMSLLNSAAPPAIPTKSVAITVPETSTGRFWAEVDYLGWTVRGDRLPALITTSPPGTPRAQAGVLGAPGTTVLFGASDANDGWRSGTLLQGGYWFDSQQTSGVEASVFGLESLSSGLGASSSGSPTLARPFFNSLINQQDALLVALPGGPSGSVAAHELSRMLGAGALYHQNILSWGGNAGGPPGGGGLVGPLGSFWGSGHIGVLVGYRYRYMSDRLEVASATTSGPVTINFSDSLNAANNFHGLDLGLSGDLRKGAWSLEWRGKVALGANLNDTRINGSAASTVDGISTVAPGGLLAPPNALGHSSQTRFAAIPEISMKVGYKVTSNWQLAFGYSAMYWSGVQRAGDLINTSFDPSAPPPPQGQPQGQGGPPPNRSSLLTQGFNVGMKYAY